MNSVWVVTSGNYSDYHIDGIFRTREEAINWIGPINEDCDGKFNVREWKLGEPGVRRPVGTIVLQLVNGELKYVRTDSSKHSYITIRSDKDGTENLCVAVPITEYTQESVDRAIKIASEKRALVLNNLTTGLIPKPPLYQAVYLDYDTALPEQETT